jgi:hypothetical protein
VSDAPAASCAKVESTRVSHHRSPVQTGSPCAMVLTASFALSSVTGLFCHRRFTIDSIKLSASVGAPGPHDFAVREKPALVLASLASTASHRNVRDDRDPPLIRRETRGVLSMICPTS